MTEDPHAEFYRLIEKAAASKAEIDALMEPFTDARRKFFRSRSEADKQAWAVMQGKLEEAYERFRSFGPKLQEALGLSDAEIEALEKEFEPKPDEVDRTSRATLSADKIAPTSWIQEHLSAGIDILSALIPKELLQHDPEAFRTHEIIKGTSPLSLVKGLRIESELPKDHRLKQMLSVARDYLADHVAFDHFAAASLTPQLAQFGRQFANLQMVDGDVAGRTTNLWKLPSAQMDAALFELLVASGCVEKGRRVEFFEETNEKSPDLRAKDPVPLVIECKRRRPFSDYELAEEKVMRELFFRLEAEAQRKGMRGRFDLHLKVEANVAPLQEIAERLISQRLAPHPDRLLDYEWGRVAYHEVPKVVELKKPTRIYSASMLHATFGWNTDIPEWDGLICRAANKSDPIIQEVQSPIALAWNNISEHAVKKRAWAPINLFGDAVSQIPRGEYGIVYVAYAEGAREKIADDRVANFLSRIQEWEHSASIRLPVSFLVRLYPRSLEDGEPDLIESTMSFASGAAGMSDLVNDFPNAVYTATAQN